MGAFYFSQKNTEEQNTQSFTETLSQPNSQNVTANRGLTPSPSYSNPYILIPLPNTNMKEKKAMITSMNVARKNIKKPATFPFSVPNL